MEYEKYRQEMQAPMLIIKMKMKKKRAMINQKVCFSGQWQIRKAEGNGSKFFSLTRNTDRAAHFFG
jgi:hypothetical protein